MCPHYSLLLVTLALAIVPCLCDSSNIDEDSTCLMQVKHSSYENSLEILLGTNATLDSPSYNVMEHIVNALDKSSFDMPPVWDFETLDAGGLHANDAHKHHKLHPLWRPEWWRCIEGHSLEAGVGIFLAGILCCAGGIGGGGIYVTVLMVFGALSVRDAVPLSKVIVFAASTPSLILNAMKTISVDESESEGEQRALIDWNLLRIVVPFALVGTLLGVYLNSILPGKLIVGLLSLILLFLTVMISRTGYQQHCQEKLDEKAEAAKAHSSNPQNSTVHLYHKEPRGYEAIARPLRHAIPTPSPFKDTMEPNSSLQATENAGKSDDDGAEPDARSVEKARNAADQGANYPPIMTIGGLARGIAMQMTPPSSPTTSPKRPTGLEGLQQNCQEKLDGKAEADKAQSSSPQKSTAPLKDTTEPNSSLQAKEKARKTDDDGAKPDASSSWQAMEKPRKTDDDSAKPNSSSSWQAMEKPRKTDDDGAKPDASSSWQAMEKARNAADQRVRKIPINNMQSKGTEKAIFRVDELTKTEVRLSLSALLLIIYCGVIHYYAGSCAKDVTNSGACRQPFGLIFTFGMMPYIKSTRFIHYMGDVAMTVAILYCTVLGTIATYYIVRNNQVYGSLHKFESIGNRRTSLIIAFYVVMSAVTGCLAGLVGIGGGLIFSPVFIGMNIDPHIAVASSATCVIFTSSSTTFQYLFTDRIIVALVFSFCIPHLLAAYTGTKIVHYIQDNYGARKSWITWIVALGVGISFVLAVQKLFSKHRATD